ncbi:MAG: hypothetical protein U0746_03510 [Gemmataceae bacterium]
MRRTFRSCMIVGSFAAIAPLSLAEEPVWKNPIAASNALTQSPPLPPPVPQEAKSVISVAPTQKRAALPGPSSVTAYLPPPPPVPSAAPKAPSVALPAIPVVTPPVPAVVVPRPVNWSAPRAAVLGSALPVSERPMVPCDLNTPATPTPAKSVTTTTAKINAGPPAPAVPAVKPLATCQLCAPGETRPTPPADVTYAVVRRDGGAPLRPTDATRLRQAVIAACRDVGGEVETQELPDKQVKVAVAVRSPRDWSLLYARLQGLPELGDYGLAVQARIKK